MLANEERGEFDIELAGGTFSMRPSWDAIQAFEKGTGRSLLVLAGQAAAKALDTRSMATIVVECVAAWGRAKGIMSAQGFDIDRTAGMIMDSPGGPLVLCERLRLMLYMAATGGITSSGEVRAPVAKAAPVPEIKPSATARKRKMPAAGG
ncbi:hypothetical protein [Sphingomonas bacterium]|uniref:hypothetical protein n=1 Tax=Sphingomonas bacterium TaxID=1895847 RepID=UPI0015761032|nr:hypothetical protein [Sphingomonas bacterium]